MVYSDLMSVRKTNRCGYQVKAIRLKLQVHHDTVNEHNPLKSVAKKKMVGRSISQRRYVV